MSIFPVIRNISDVMPYIVDREEFFVSHKEGYDVINYRFNMPSTFPDYADDFVAAGILRECRGIKFCSKTGDILARPLHKFFNVGEKPETKVDAIIWSNVIRIDHKLDGSMIHPLFVNGQLIWSTKMGETQISPLVDHFIETYKCQHIVDFVNYCHTVNCTPIFEFTSLENRVVVRYERPALTLLAIKHNYTGRYEPEIIANAVAHFGIEVVDRIDGTNDPKATIQNAIDKNEIGCEGFVLVFANGQRMKWKTEWYVNLHRAKDKISSVKNVIPLILDNTIDDLYPILDNETSKHVREYHSHVVDSVAYACHKIYSSLTNAKAFCMSRKQFALSTVNSLPSTIRPICWEFFDDATLDIEKIYDSLCKHMIRKCNSNRGAEELSDILGTKKYREVTNLGDE